MARRGRPPYPDILTPREWEVLALLREGCSNEEIAERLAISLAGAKYHVSEILGKLGVESREEAARWSASGGRPRPWWAIGAAPLGWLWRKASAGPLAAAAAAGAALLVATGVGLLVWGLLRTNGASSESSVVGLATATESQSGIPTRPPFVAATVDCPGGYSTPEGAIGACLEIRRSYTTYVGDCDTPQPVPTSTGIFDRPCSSWADEQGNMRAYVISDLGSDGFDWAILEQEAGGWTATMWSGCAIQSEVNRDSELEGRQADLSSVRNDDCRIAPAPLPRPALRVGLTAEAATENGRTRLSIYGGLLYPSRGMKLRVVVRNVSGTILPWSADNPATIELVTQDGKATAASAVGGTLARSVQGSMPVNAFWAGWLIFPVDEPGSYTLRYPGQPDLTLDLTPATCLFFCGGNPKE